MENKYILRDMKEEDIADLVEIEEKSFHTPWTKGAFKKELKNKMAKYVVIQVGQKVVAYAGVWLIVDEGHITNVAVHPDYRGKKFGNVVMEGIIGKCQENNIKAMTLEVRVTNNVARKLYEKYGFKNSGIRPEYYQDTREDALIMWKEF